MGVKSDNDSEDVADAFCAELTAMLTVRLTSDTRRLTASSLRRFARCSRSWKIGLYGVSCC